jgi:hypothetical protein
MKPFPDFNSPAGIRAVAEHLDGLAADPDLTGFDARHIIGHLRIRPNRYALTTAAMWLREKAPRAGGKRSGVWLTPQYTIPLRAPGDTGYTAKVTGVLAMDAVRHCGSPEAALETIRRQLDTQGESMDPADVKRCERAARLIESHIA